MSTPLLIPTCDDDPNRFHTYIEEILLTEGYPWFRRLDLAHTPLRAEALDAAAVTILEQIKINEQVHPNVIRSR